MHQVRRDAQENAPLSAGLTDAIQVCVLQVAEPTMHDLEAIGRGRMGEVASLYQGNR
jgi:hypothetical protein